MRSQHNRNNPLHHHMPNENTPNEPTEDQIDPNAGNAGVEEAPQGDTPPVDLDSLFADHSPTAGLKTTAATAPAAKPATTQQPVSQQGARPVLPAVDQNSRANKLAAIKDAKVREMLKQMGNQPFEHFYNIALQRESGELLTKADAEKLATDRLAAEQAKFQTLADEAKATRFFDHEQGYKLTPEYQQYEQHANNLSNEMEFWNIQLQNFHAGQPVQLLELDEKNNPRIAAQRYDPKQNPGLLAEITGSISRGTAIQMDLRRQMDAIPKSHKEQFGKFSGIIQELDKTDFAAVKAPIFHKTVETELARFPKALQARPEIQLLSKYKSMAQLLYNKVTELTAQETARTNASASRIAAAPSTADLATSADGPSSEFSEQAGIDAIEAIVSRRH